jgi:Tfp pilus assembly protein PilO
MAASDWSEKTRIIITVAVGVVVNAGLAFWLYTAYDQYAVLEQQSNTKKKERAQLKNTVEVEKPELDKELAKLKSSLAKKESLLPEQAEVEQLMNSVGERAQEAGATLLSFAKANNPTAEGNYEKTVYRTRWQADFMSWCKLMNSMEEKFRRFIAFENLQLTPPSSGLVLMGAKHEISVDVVVYRYVRQN